MSARGDGLKPFDRSNGLDYALYNYNNIHLHLYEASINIILCKWQGGGIRHYNIHTGLTPNIGWKLLLIVVHLSMTAY